MDEILGKEKWVKMERVRKVRKRGGQGREGGTTATRDIVYKGKWFGKGGKDGKECGNGRIAT